MQSFDIVRETEAKESFRVSSIVGKYDLGGTKVREHFKGAFSLPDDWQIGLIVGASGTGKTTLLNEVFKDYIKEPPSYNSRSVIDDMPQDATVEQISKTFNSVGFSSPPSWLKPFSVLSNGEKMRVNLAYALLQDYSCFAFDEFTSVVDRNVAKIGSYAMQKAIRKTSKKFIACTCHYDVEQWLLPDWIFDTNSMNLKKKPMKADQNSKSKYTNYATRQSTKLGKCLLDTTI